MIPQKIRNGMDYMKSRWMYIITPSEEKSSASGIKAKIKNGKHTAQNNM